MTVDGPTRGASENASDSQWDASTRLALVVRIVIWLIPTVGAFAGLYLIVDLLYRPAGTIGLALWFAQGVAVGTMISVVLDRWARRLLPLVALLKMSMIFPDEAPSRFAVALRAGSFRRIERRVAEVNRNGLGADASEASAKAIELITVLSGHDRMTRGHTERVRAYADIIATEMGLSEEDRAKLAWGVMLHDIGKVTVPADVLNKTGLLTDTEWALLKTHPGAGGRLLAPLQDWLGPWARAAADHHERWDGGGYPLGLAGEEISLAGRITAVADAYDVITSNRSYKKALSVQAARREMVDRAGSHFDPAVVRAFLNVSLGRRWTAGLLATMSNLPLTNLTSAPAVISAGIAASAVSLVAVIPEPVVPEALAFDEVVVVEESTTSATTAPPSTSVVSSTSAAPTTTTTQPTTASTAAPTT
ncbi:MAG: HD-GYP domain-containing protein, partial [Acidimicrobiia bacterium]|nr:HD-GYP domain-containing protein [Acidimicrobiia bacterium]